MTTRTPTRMYGPAFIASTTAADIFTVPAATSAVVKHLHIVKAGNTKCFFTLSIGTDAAGTRLYPTNYLIEDQVTDLFVYFPMATGEKMQAFATGVNGASATNALDLTVSGDYLT